CGVPDFISYLAYSIHDNGHADIYAISSPPLPLWPCDIIPFIVYFTALSHCVAIIAAMSLCLLRTSVRSLERLNHLLAMNMTVYSCVGMSSDSIWRVSPADTLPLSSITSSILFTPSKYYSFHCFLTTEDSWLNYEANVFDNIFLKPASMLNVAFPSPSVERTLLDMVQVAFRKSVSPDSQCIARGSTRSRQCSSPQAKTAIPGSLWKGERRYAYLVFVDNDEKCIFLSTY
ncbi:hypothetical protein F5146DRAFT_1158896, partial [Armillaria mellea]